VQHERQLAAVPQHDGHAAERAAHRDGEQLIEVVSVAIAVRMIVSHETNLLT